VAQIAKSNDRPSAAVLRSAWLRALAGGSATYALVILATDDTQNPHLLPVLLLLGAALVPVTFVVFLFERMSVDAAVLPTVAVCFAAGGSVGVAAASLLEYQTLRDLGTLPMIAVGLIEESVKLALPLYLLARGRFRAPGYGVLFGVAAGMGFAALESMGYGLVALIESGGRVGAAEQVVLLRGLVSPVAHAAWTGLVCAALWRSRARTGPIRWWVALAAAFAAAVALHTLWDSTDSFVARAAIGILSGALLAASVRRVRA
jgi:RsiW-degrading membrane proteinase PrsW (M82 family)